MLNILINAYAVSPNWGSEPGVGWNWVIRLAKECNVFVITESEWQEEIMTAVNLLPPPTKNNLHFYFNPVSEKVRKMCWTQGDWRFYHYYREWQKRTLSIAQGIISKNRIDVIHQLNMIGFREPGYLWQIKNVPYVWGPIGNMSPLRMDYLDGTSFTIKVKALIKNVITKIQSRYGRVSKAIYRADFVITALNDTARIIRSIYGIENIMTMPEAGLTVLPECIHHIGQTGKLKLLWVGRFIPTKKLNLALEILSKLNSKEFELHIIGWGSKGEETFYRSMAENLNVSDRCFWYGKIPNDKVQTLMQSSDLLLFTSVVEGTPHVVLEAIANNLPVMCFDLCGQGVIVNEDVGIKIPVDNSLATAVNTMVSELIQLSQQRSKIMKLSKNCEMRKPQLSWDEKISTIIHLYHQLLADRQYKS